DAAIVGLPDEQRGAALADAGDEQLVAAADLLDVGDVRLADGDARDVADLDHFLLSDAEGDGASLALRVDCERGDEEEREQGSSEDLHRVWGSQGTCSLANVYRIQTSRL